MGVPEQWQSLTFGDIYLAMATFEPTCKLLFTLLFCDNSFVDVQQCLPIVSLPRKTFLLSIYHRERALIPGEKTQQSHDASGHAGGRPDLAPTPK